ncbi:ATPase, T2SS/T4P/T4SS family [Aquabacterium sp. A7-Y]|uniref:GspE/PulE family protein n=1 Tax=Aquabacterium sp. A7-Y TaxID=1349605 RepID=UPI00223D800B|nr:ATPase, T2SS/T4P/T4SS family [Aquabacterium sp. A7-Y]MCW7536939.1 ATPase, T2SS/T4P/T4SS family [Aquabacterium sp. A7-Y]
MPNPNESWSEQTAPFGPLPQLPEVEGYESFSAKEQRPAFRWPTPPFGAYPPPSEQQQALACEIEGLNGRRRGGRLVFIVPEEEVAHVQIPPARTTMTLRFGQFRSLTLLDVLPALPEVRQDPYAGVLDLHPRMPFHVRMNSGEDLEGHTVGHVETDEGLFLFPPADAQGGVRRVFVPRHSYRSVEIGPRIGELLVAQKAATPRAVEQVAAQQQEIRERKLGDILVTRKIVRREQLLAALEQQSRMPMVRIGEALLSLGLVTQADLDGALREQKAERSLPLGELLVQSKVVSRRDLQTALAHKMGYPLVDVLNFPAEPEALRKVPVAVASRLHALPLVVREGRLVVALEDPSRRSTLEELEFVSQLKIVPALAQVGSMEAAIRAAYEKIGSDVWTLRGAPLVLDFEPSDTSKLVETLEKEGATGASRIEEEVQIEQSDNSLVRLINNMIVEAHNQGVSDIHVESYPGREKIKIRFRKDGLLQSYLELPHTYRNALISRIKIMCDLDISERRKPQDGKINFARFVPGQKLELRVATIPTNNGLEDVVMRILASAKPLPLDDLGLSEPNLRQLKEAMQRPYGLVLCVGPTGSGKTTTLHSAMSFINVPERKIWTAEDPVEITQPGLRQVQVNAKIDWTFAKALRAFLRADPDVIMVGEIRDEETAKIAVEASLTGHLVLSTLHTNSAPETVTRLLDMGMDPFNFADSLLAVLAQRLVRRLCSACRQSRPATEEEIGELLGDYLNAHLSESGRPARTEVLGGWLRRYGREGRLMSHHSPGCDACAHTGFRGRLGLHELMVATRGLRRLVQTGATAEQLQQQALLEGMRTLRQDGIEKVLQGATSLAEVRAISNE